jgi:hypothetical protein
MKIVKSAFFVTVFLACLTHSAIMINPTKADVQKLINASPLGNTLLYLESGIGIGAIAVFIVPTIYFVYSYKRSPNDKKRARNIVRILCVILPFVLGYVITYATGVFYSNPIGSPPNSYGFPFAWLDTEGVFLYPSGVDFASFLVDFSFFSGIYAVAFWFAYYINS